MGKPPVFSPQQEAEIARRRAAGESTPSIARSLGTSHQNVQNSLKRSAEDGADLGPARDEFEAKQLAVVERIEEKLERPKLSASGLAALTKALNDTIKSIRQHRVHSKATRDDSDHNEMIAEQVRARLERIAARPERIVAALPAVEEPSQDGKNGTEE